jgi:hypothetical protein
MRQIMPYQPLPIEVPEQTQNHALEDYYLQLALLEQNEERHLMDRQEQPYAMSTATGGVPTTSDQGVLGYPLAMSTQGHAAVPSNSQGHPDGASSALMLEAQQRASAVSESPERLIDEAKIKMLAREQNRDMSEKVALGLAKPTRSGEAMYDSRLFNQSSRFNAGFNEDSRSVMMPGDTDSAVEQQILRVPEQQFRPSIQTDPPEAQQCVPAISSTPQPLPKEFTAPAIPWYNDPRNVIKRARSRSDTGRTPGLAELMTSHIASPLPIAETPTSKTDEENYLRGTQQSVPAVSSAPPSLFEEGSGATGPWYKNAKNVIGRSRGPSDQTRLSELERVKVRELIAQHGGPHMPMMSTETSNSVSKDPLTYSEDGKSDFDVSHQCNVCGKVFYRKDLLARHQERHAGDDERGTDSESVLLPLTSTPGHIPSDVTATILPQAPSCYYPPDNETLQDTRGSPHVRDTPGHSKTLCRKDMKGLLLPPEERHPDSKDRSMDQEGSSELLLASTSEDSTRMELNPPLLRLSRPVAACSPCRAAGVKCDGKLPSCTICESSNRADDCSKAVRVPSDATATTVPPASSYYQPASPIFEAPPLSWHTYDPFTPEVTPTNPSPCVLQFNNGSSSHATAEPSSSGRVQKERRGPLSAEARGKSHRIRKIGGCSNCEAAKLKVGYIRIGGESNADGT